MNDGGLVTKPCPTLATPWTIVGQAHLPMEFSRQEYWSGLPFSSPGDTPPQGSNPCLFHCRWILKPPGKPGFEYRDITVQVLSDKLININNFLLGFMTIRFQDSFLCYKLNNENERQILDNSDGIGNCCEEFLFPVNRQWLRFAVPTIEVSKPTIGEGNGTPLQYSCLENPMDGGAW